MEVPDKRVKNIAINKKVAIIVRQMINASVSAQCLCTEPDGIPNIVLKEFAFELAPLIADMYNTSLCEGVVPPLKHAIVSPLPKQMPPKSVENDIRPISLTNQVAKIMESFTFMRSLPDIYEDLDCKQFAAAGMSTQHAIAYVLHLVLEALDSGSCSARLFFLGLTL